MEKKLLCVFALGTMALAMASCGNGKSDNQTSSTDTVQQAVQPEKPYADSPSTYAQSVKLGGQEFVISITRKADPGQPIVTDELGKQFYDNRVEVNITSDGRDFFHHSYTREAFEDFLHENEKQGTVLLGMPTTPRRAMATPFAWEPKSDRSVSVKVPLSRSKFPLMAVPPASFVTETRTRPVTTDSRIRKSSEPAGPYEKTQAWTSLEEARGEWLVSMKSSKLF